MTAPTVPLLVSGHHVAEYVVEPDVDPLHGPRPYLHPVRTLAGVVVSDAGPADHPWHLGASLSMQDVNGTNLWGGRTYVRGADYLWLADHGRIVHVEWLERTDATLRSRLHWYDPSGRLLVVEESSLTAAPLAGRSDAWVLDVAYELRGGDDAAVKLGSPGSNGLPGSGYGGFFWRAASASTPRVFTASTDDEREVNGSTGPWVAMVCADPVGAGATLVFTGLGDGDAWFVRAAQYPGVCVALAFDEPRVISPGAALRRRHRIAVVDGALDAAAAAALADGLTA
ncbi:MAG TPA: PmoA family protein [Micromonosporaceae bacterium]|nr:PmoA family protein [Micromonosporaceae bacterium]